MCVHFSWYASSLPLSSPSVTPSSPFLVLISASPLTYTLPVTVIINTFIGHHDLVYDIVWSPNDDAILTASSDGTAKIWPFPFPSKSGTAVVALQHTCFVYAAQFFPNQDMNVRIVATGAYPNLLEESREGKRCNKRMRGTKKRGGERRRGANEVLFILLFQVFVP